MDLRSFLQPPRLYFLIAGALILSYWYWQKHQAAATPLPNAKANGKGGGKGKGRSYKVVGQGG